jgi:hypothetical protein
MPDLIERLEAIAPSPREELDFGRIATRARRRRTGRQVGGASAVAVLLVAASLGLGAIDDARLTPEIVGEPDTRTGMPVTPDPTSSQVVEDNDVADPDGTAPGAIPMPRRSGPAATPTDEPVPTPTTRDVAVPTAEPSPSEQVAPEPEPTETTTPSGCRTPREACSFVATGPGGFEADGRGDWTITIVRNGDIVQFYEGRTGPLCMSNVIEPGDQVFVDGSAGSVDEPTPAGAVYRDFDYVAAGEEYGCRS